MRERKNERKKERKKGQPVPKAQSPKGGTILRSFVLDARVRFQPRLRKVFRGEEGEDEGRVEGEDECEGVG